MLGKIFRSDDLSAINTESMRTFAPLAIVPNGQISSAGIDSSETRQVLLFLHLADLCKASLLPASTLGPSRSPDWRTADSESSWLA